MVTHLTLPPRQLPMHASLGKIGAGGDFLLFWTSFQGNGARCQGCTVVQVCAKSAHQEAEPTHSLSCCSCHPYHSHTEYQSSARQGCYLLGLPSLLAISRSPLLRTTN